MTAKSEKKGASPRAAKRAAPRGEIESGGAEPRLLLFLGLAWFFGFSLFFYSFTLPNRPDHVGRFDILFSLPDLLPVSGLRSAQWGNLGQRADLIGVAVLILSGAWGLGQLAMRIVRPPLERLSIEHTFFAMALGMSATSLLTLFCGLAGCLNRWFFIGVFAGAVAGELLFRMRERSRSAHLEDATARSAKEKAARSEESIGHLPLFWLTLAVMIPFLFVMWLGSMTPEADFDVGSYHFEGPKEYFQNGRITFLPHNVYTNFPFLTEMFALLGMVLHGDWFWGAVAGKCALFAFAPLTALGLYAAGRRWFSPTAGLIAALVHLTTPWIDRVTIIALSEGGLTFYFFATLFAVMLAVERMRERLSATRSVLLAGLMAGSGMACKYTGLVQTVLPAAIALLLAPWFVRRSADSTDGREGKSLPTGDAASSPRAIVLSLAVFSLGVALTAGPWLLKNLVLTGNPVYPLAYTTFGGRGWTETLNAKFVPAHSPKDHRLLDLFKKVEDVAADNDWSSALLFGLAPLALFVRSRRRVSIALWLVVAYLLLTYWGFTHRIDRFWMPMIPVVALLAGIGATWSRSRPWVWGSGVLIALTVWFNFGFDAGTPYSGYNAMLSDHREARRIEENVHPFVPFMNRTLPKGAKVLFVGEQEVFDAQFSVVYNTVFNKSIFQEWFAADAPGTKERDLPLKSPHEILAKLHAEGITHIFVNWDWIRRYHEPGNYGYTEFVSPDRFSQLVKAGVLGPPVTLAMMSTEGMSTLEEESYEARLPFTAQTDDGRTVLFTGRFRALSDQELATLKEVGPSLLTRAGGHEVMINAQVFPVR